MNRFMLFMICFVTMTNLLYSTTVNGRLVLNTFNDSTLEAKIQINTDTGTDDLGGVTMVVRYDSTQLYFPSTLSPDTDYIFHNFCGGNYSTAFITRPFPNELWLNIELDSNNCGIVVAGLDSWTDVVTLKLKPIGNLPYSIINFVVNSPYAAIYDGDNCSLWKIGDFSLISSIEDKHETLENFSLSQNYPNPFNPSTKIRYMLKEESQVRLVVYNLLGEAIKELVNNKIAAGNHEFTFNSDGLPSGTYIYRLEANSKFMGAKKMVLLK